MQKRLRPCRAGRLGIIVGTRWGWPAFAKASAFALAEKEASGGGGPSVSEKVLAVTLAIGFCFPAMLGAQRGRGGRGGEKPTVDIVQTVGCAERKGGNLDTWWLNRAVDTRVAPPGIFNSNQVDQAKGVALGSNVFQLVGVADFLDPESLLKSGRRKEFTTQETVNATGELGHGRKVLVKGLLIEGDQKRINLLAVIGLSDNCP